VLTACFKFPSKQLGTNSSCMGGYNDECSRMDGFEVARGRPRESRGRDFGCGCVGSQSKYQTRSRRNSLCLTTFNVIKSTYLQSYIQYLHGDSRCRIHASTYAARFMTIGFLLTPIAVEDESVFYSLCDV